MRPPRTGRASPSGSTGPISRLSLDPAGQVVDKTPGLIAGPGGGLLVSARFDDGTVLLTWLSNGGAVLAQCVGETGGALSSPTTLQNPVMTAGLSPFAVSGARSPPQPHRQDILGPAQAPP